MNKKAMLPSRYRCRHCLAQRKGVGARIMSFGGSVVGRAGGHEVLRTQPETVPMRAGPAVCAGERITKCEKRRGTQHVHTSMPVSALEAFWSFQRGQGCPDTVASPSGTVLYSGQDESLNFL